MKNVEMTVPGNILTIKVDLSKEYGPSSSGKTITIASTEGNVSAPDRDEVKVGLNIYRSCGAQPKPLARGSSQADLWLEGALSTPFHALFPGLEDEIERRRRRPAEPRETRLREDLPYPRFPGLRTQPEADLLRQ
jgi:hypothetical protein